MTRGPRVVRAQAVGQRRESEAVPGHRRRPRREDPRRPLRPGRGAPRPAGPERHVRSHVDDAAAGAAAAQRRRADRPAARPRHVRHPAAPGLPVGRAPEPRRRPEEAGPRRPHRRARPRSVRRAPANIVDRGCGSAPATPRYGWNGCASSPGGPRSIRCPGSASRTPTRSATMTSARSRCTARSLTPVWPSPARTETIRPGTLAATTARHLQEPAGSPVFVSDRVTYTPRRHRGRRRPGHDPRQHDGDPHRARRDRPVPELGSDPRTVIPESALRPPQTCLSLNPPAR